ncbi:unnamed protein product, partial [Brachionus calyciflorus]
MNKIFLIVLIIVYISVTKINCREHLSIIGSDRHTNWGNWHAPVFCPGNSLTCDDTASTRIQSGEGPYGNWYTEKGTNKRSIESASNTNSSISARGFSALAQLLPDILSLLGQAAELAVFLTNEKLSNKCNNLGKFVGFEFEAEPPVNIIGRNRKETKKYCPDGQAICGIRTQIEPKVSGDNTALNNVDFYCCKNYYKLFNVATTKALDSDYNGRVYTLDNNDSLHQRWELIKRDDIYFSFKNAQTGLILDSNTVGNVYAISDNGSDYQKWFKDDKNRIVNKATKRALDSNSQGHVYTLDPNS